MHAWRPDLSLQPSSQLAFGIVWLTLAVLVALGWALPTSIRVGVLGAVIVLGCYGVWRYALLRGANAITRLRWCDDGWMLQQGSGAQRTWLGPMHVTARSRLFRQGMVLYFRPYYEPQSKAPLKQRVLRRLITWRHYWVPLSPDMLPDQAYRYFQVFMRWQPSTVLNPQKRTQGLDTA